MPLSVFPTGVGSSSLHRSTSLSASLPPTLVIGNIAADDINIPSKVPTQSYINIIKAADPLSRNILKYQQLYSLILRYSTKSHVLSNMYPQHLWKPKFSLEAGGIVALADLTTIAERTALMGTASWFDVLIIAPGIHLHQKSAELANAGELPPTAAIRKGYIFRVENQAMVGWLQSVGKPGHLVDVFVEPTDGVPVVLGDETHVNPIFASGTLAIITYLLAPTITIIAVILMGIWREWWSLAIIFVLMFARLVNVAIMKRRSKPGWKGAPSKGPGDLLILLSQDRWIRMRGMNDDIKAVTSGQWLDDMSALESFASAGATLLVYLTAALSANATTLGNIMLMVVLFLEVGLLGFSNKFVTGIHMYGRVVKVIGKPKKYARRLDLANDLIEQSGRRDWAVGLGMVQELPRREGQAQTSTKVTL